MGENTGLLAGRSICPGRVQRRALDNGRCADRVWHGDEPSEGRAPRHVKVSKRGFFFFLFFPISEGRRRRPTNIEQYRFSRGRHGVDGCRPVSLGLAVFYLAVSGCLRLSARRSVWLPFGCLWLAWLSLAVSGCLWLSDDETAPYRGGQVERGT